MYKTRVITTLVAGFIISGCADMSGTQKGAGTGALIGAGTGAAIVHWPGAVKGLRLALVPVPR